MPKKSIERRAEVRDTGTSSQSSAGVRKTKPTTGLPPDPQDLGRPLSADEKVDEAGLESMDASDPPAHSSAVPGAPKEAEPSEEAIARRAYELWESENRPHGKDRKHWQEAASELKKRSGPKGGQAHRSK